MTAIMGTMSEPCEASPQSVSIGLAGILVFRGLLVIRLGLATARLVIRLRFPKLQTVQCRVKERGGIGDKTVLFAAERGVVPQREGLLVRFRERCDRIVRVFAEFGKLGLCRRDRSFERALVEFGRIIIHGLISWDGQFGELIVHLGVEASVEVHDTEPCAGQVHLSDFQIVWIVGAFGERHVGRFAVGRALACSAGVERAARGVVERGAILAAPCVDDEARRAERVRSNSCVVVDRNVLAGGNGVAVLIDEVDRVAVDVERIPVGTPYVVGDHCETVTVGIAAHAGFAMPCVAGRGRRMQEQFGSGRGIITTEFRIEVAVSTNVDTGLEWLAVRAGPLGHLEHDRRAARQRPCGFLGSGAMHLLVGVGVPVRERYGGRIVDLPHAVAVGDETLGDFSLGGRHLVCCGV